MGRPVGTKNRPGSKKPGAPAGTPKQKQPKTCVQCGETYMGYPGNSYCSRKCLLLRNIEKSDGCWLWTGYKRKGPRGSYGEVYFGTKPNRERVLAHRAVYAEFVGDPSGKVVCHHCDNPSCVRPDHLFLGTIADNTRDRDAKGRQARGERNGPAKLTEGQVRAIRDDARGYRKLAKAYDVQQSTIQKIKKRLTWRHVE